MNNIQQLTPGKIVSFELYPSTLLGNIQHMHVDAVINYATANRLGFDPTAMHVRVYPTLPEGTENRADSYQYVMLSKPNDPPVIVGLPWIKENTVVFHQSFNAQIVVENVEPGDETTIRQILHANGFNAVSVKITQ